METNCTTDELSGNPEFPLETSLHRSRQMHWTNLHIYNDPHTESKNEKKETALT